MMKQLGIIASSITKGGGGEAWDSNALDNTANDTFDFDYSAITITFKPDGTKMYTIKFLSDIDEWDLSSAWDITTAVHNQSVVGPFWWNRSSGLSFKPDGTKLYVTANDIIEEYDLTVAWDISTYVFSDSFSYVTQGRGLYFKDDGTKCYRTNSTTDNVEEFDLSSAWDLTTISINQTLDVSSETTDPFAIFFKPDGTKMYIGTATGILQYDLSVAWDISSATWDTITTNTIYGQGYFWHPDGDRFFANEGAASTSLLEEYLIV